MQTSPLPLARRTTAFTLQELIIVIVIIAVLAALLMPVLSLVNARSRTLQCQNNLHQIFTGFAGYASDNNGMMPVIDDWRMASANNPQKYYVWFHAIQPYVGTANAKTKNVLICPSVQTGLKVPIPVTYTLNRGMGEDPTQQLNGTHAPRFVQPSKKVLLFDSGTQWSSIAFSDIQSGKYGTDPNTSVFTQIHSGKANVLFCDGHVALSDFKQDLNDVSLWTLNTF